MINDQLFWNLFSAKPKSCQPTESIQHFHSFGNGSYSIYSLRDEMGEHPADQRKTGVKPKGFQNEITLAHLGIAYHTSCWLNNPHICWLCAPFFSG